jgi:hypothetical protein
MIILSPPDAAVTGERLAALPRLPLDPGGAVFAEPRQAQAFVLAVKLSEQGHFTWTEWPAATGAPERAAAVAGDHGFGLGPGADKPHAPSKRTRKGCSMIQELLAEHQRRAA